MSRTDNAARSPLLRSRVTNGATLFANGGDMRSPWARRMRDLIELHVRDLGGHDELSEAERSIVRRSATLEIQLEQLEATFSEGAADPDALDLYSRLTNTLRRSLESVGLERRVKLKDITPSTINAMVGRRTADKPVAA